MKKLSKKILNELIRNSLISQFRDLILKIDTIRFLGEKIWGRRILPGDWNLRNFLETYMDKAYLSFLGNGVCNTKEVIIQNVAKQAERMQKPFVNKSEKTLFLIFLDHELNFFKFVLELKEISSILNVLDEKDRGEFSKSLSKKIRDNEINLMKFQKNLCLLRFLLFHQEKIKGKILPKKL
jgi:hypothetical protein